MEAGRNGRISVRVENTRAGLGGDRCDEDGEDNDEDDKNKFSLFRGNFNHDLLLCILS